MLTLLTPTTDPSPKRQRVTIDPNYTYPKGIMRPWEFAVIFLGHKLYPWQAEVLEALGQQLPVALCAANGSGKTQVIISSFILWFLYTFPRGICPVTSGSWTQLSEQLWPSVFQYRQKFPKWHWTKGRIQTPEGGRLILFSVADPGRAEGYHGTINPQDHEDRTAQETWQWAKSSSPSPPSPPQEEPPAPDWLGGAADEVDVATATAAMGGTPCAYIIDEAKTVGSGIFTACNRCTKQYQIFSSSPGPPSGEFYDCFHSLGSFYYQKRVTFYDCPHLKEETRAMDEAKYGIDNPYYRSRYLAEFTDEEGPGLIISKEVLARCIQNPPQHRPGRITVFCDFAGGTDENVVAVCDGNRVDLHACWIEDDTMQACQKFVEIFEDLHRVYPRFVMGDIYGDNGGMGKSMIDRISQLGWFIHRIDFGGEARQKTIYANRGTEIWWETVKEIEKCQLILPNDRIFFEQATNRRRLFNERGRMAAEPKREMFRRGLKSPDRADAVLGALWARRGGSINSLEDLANITFQRNPFEPLENLEVFEFTEDIDRWKWG